MTANQQRPGVLGGCRCWLSLSRSPLSPQDQDSMQRRSESWAGRSFFSIFSPPTTRTKKENGKVIVRKIPRFTIPLPRSFLRLNLCPLTNNHNKAYGWLRHASRLVGCVGQRRDNRRAQRSVAKDLESWNLGRHPLKPTAAISVVSPSHTQPPPSPRPTIALRFALVWCVCG